MIRRPYRTMSVVVPVILFTAAAFAGGPIGTSGHSELDTLGRQAYRALWDFHPVNGTQCGFHEFDGRLGDYSPARVAALEAQVTKQRRVFQRLLDVLGGGGESCRARPR